MPGNASSRVVLSSVGTRWNDILLEQRNIPNCELTDLTYKQHLVAINIGHSTTWEFKKEGRFRHFFKGRGAISFFPSHQPLSGRLKVERGLFANVLFLVLDPVLVSRVAETLELDANRIELVEQRRSTDPTLRHIAMALRAGIQSGDALDRMSVSPIRAILHVISKESSAYLLSGC